jgi:arginyl-tRNA synthetase
MNTAENTLEPRLRAAVSATFGSEFDNIDPQLRAATRPEFGHFQTNLPLRLAKPLRLPPLQIADRLLAALDVSDICEQPEVAGQGFINLTLRPAFLAAEVTSMLSDARLGVPVPAQPQRVVVDFSSPNVAKQMHVGHLRSTVIGDSLARVLAFAGHDVVRQNHIGDWGTQFGMLIEQLLDEDHDGSDLDLSALDSLYRRARARFETDAAFADRSRGRVVALQAGDTQTVEIWQRLVSTSLAAFDEMYERLDAGLSDADAAGESSYNDALEQVVSDLTSAGVLTQSEGALCVFLPGYTGRDGEPLPLIVRKADGGYGYVATNLAEIRSRVGQLHAD